MEKDMEKIYDVAIIGGGPAGYSAALYASRAGLSTVVIEKMSVGGQMALTDIIDNYPGFDEGVDGFSLGMKMQRGAERFGAETLYGEVLSVDFSEKVKRIDTDSSPVLARSVIISTGAYPRTLGIDGESERFGRGVHYCAHCDGRFYKGKRVVVVGGGNSAVSEALYLSGVAEKVILVHRRDSFRAEKIFEERLGRSNNVEFVLDSLVEKVLYDDGGVNGIEIKNKHSAKAEIIRCDAVFVAIGRRPATEIFRSVLDLDDNGYIIADESTRTSIPGVFAAGDVRTKDVRQVVTAASDGVIAVHYAERYLSSENFD
jgi:thioredoxin reductase (NADPH)